jgi:hypothetical protein
VIDLTKTSLSTFLPNDEGEYCAKLLRFDIFNKAFEDGDTHIDIAYVGIDTDIMNICELEKENFGCYPGHGGDESSYVLRYDLDPNQHELYPNVEHREDCPGPRLELEFPDMLYTDGLEMGER